ncbi:unnamed protein product [Coregonus sp. 'balchen']|nr:unnamed protein product [Coregonus sp. 'balchen']
MREVDDDEVKKEGGKTLTEKKQQNVTVSLMKLNKSSDQLWTRFAEAEMTTLTEEAGSAMDQAEATDHHHMTRRECELIHRNLERGGLQTSNEDWMSGKDLIPRSKATESKDQIRKLKKRRGSQSDDEGKLGRVKIVEQEEPVGDLQLQAPDQLERARLPMFAGNMRDYYRWKA